MTRDSDSNDRPMETAFSRAIYIWTHPDTGVRYGVHVPESNTSKPAANIDTATLRNLTIMVVQSLASVRDPLVLIHFQPHGNQIEVSIPDLGSEDVVRELARTAERGPQPFLQTLLSFFEQADHVAHVEYVEIRYNDVTDLTDSSRFTILHDANAHVPLEQTPGLVHFFRLLKQVLPAH